ncbi:MAG: hypothetical protein AAF465_03320 [Pseudomonadota bacterium]
MRQSFLLLLITIPFSVSAQEFRGSGWSDNSSRTVARRLTERARPAVVEMSELQQSIAMESGTALDLDIDPNEVICRTERVSRDAASRLKTRRCKTRAEFREESARRLAASAQLGEDAWRKLAMRQTNEAFRRAAYERALTQRALRAPGN